MVMIVAAAIVEYLRIWPPSEEGGGQADDIRGGREKKLFCTLDRQTWSLEEDGDDVGVDLHGRWKNRDDREHVLEGVDEVGEGEHREGEGVHVPGLHHHLALQQDQRDHLRQVKWLRLKLQGGKKAGRLWLKAVHSQCHSARHEAPITQKELFVESNNFWYS